MSRSSSSFGFRSSFNSSGRKGTRDNRKEANSTSDKRSCNHDPHHSDHHRHNLHEKRQRSRHDNSEAEKAARSIFGDVPLTDTERRYLWSAQSGNLPALELLVEDSASFNLCCRDYLGRTALQLSVLGEHYDCIQLLLNKLRYDIIEEGLLHAIKANNVKICDMFLSQPLYSDPRARLQFQLDNQNGIYEQEDSSSSFANDITPIVLAAQCNNFDIVHMLIQKGFTISTPHNYFCLCPECQTFKDLDRVVHSKSRLNAYRGLASTAYLSLSCDDPIYAAFELSRNLEKLAEREKEHKNEYRGLSNQCKDFAVALLDQCRTNDEVMSALHGGTDCTDLARIKMAIRYDQKKFIAHASCQEQLASMWYSGAPWFQHQSFVIKLLIVPLGIVFIPLTAIIYVFVPYSKLGRILKSPFMKFMNYICSYMAFLVLLFLGTQLTSFESVHLFNGVEGVVNGLIMFYVLGMFWAECKQLWEEGVHGYFSQLWNYMDITMLSLYTAGYSIQGVIYTKADDIELSENHLLYWKDEAIMNPQILSKILFSVANVMSFARIAYILPASETFGQLQISYGRMLQDVGKFIFIYVTVMIAFICGLTSLYSITTNTNFSGVSQTTGTLFWAAFGLGNAKAPQIGADIKDSGGSSSNSQNSLGGGRSGGAANRRDGASPNTDGGAGRGGVGGVSGGGGGGGGGGGADGVTEAEMLDVVELVGYILYGVYILGAVVVLINMLIAMMSNTFEEIQKSEDCEWKFARAKLWISFIEQGTTLPIPFNIIPTPKSILRMTKILRYWRCCRQGKFDPSYEDSQKVALEYKAVMHRVVLRYIHKMKFENREESLKDEIIDTREEVLYQMHSLMSRMSYRMEILETDVMAVSKGVQAVTGGPNLTYTRSVPSHGRSSVGSMRTTSSTSLAITQDKGGNPSARGNHLKRGRSYYHNRPKYKLSDHAIRYTENDQSNHLTATTTTTTTNTTTITSNNNNNNNNHNNTTTTIKGHHTYRSLSDSGYNNEDDDSGLGTPLPPLPIPGLVSETKGNSTRTTTGSSHHTSQGQDDQQGQGYLPLIDVTSTSGVTKAIPDPVTISTISGKCLEDATPSCNILDDVHRETDFTHGSHRRENSLRIRGSYSPRPGEDRRRINEACASRGKRCDVMGSRWGGQQDVIEESWLEDHPMSPPSDVIDMNHVTPLNTMDVGQNLRHCGSLRRRKETMSHRPNIDAPFQPISDVNDGNTFAEYRYSKPVRRETIQNLILDVNSIHNLPGLEMPGTRTPASAGCDGVGNSRSRTGSCGDRSSVSPPRKPNTIFGGTSSKEQTAIAADAPKSIDDVKRASWFNWAQPFVMFYGNNSQENLYYPMKIIRQESSERDEGGFKKGSKSNGDSNESSKNSGKGNSKSKGSISGVNSGSGDKVKCDKDDFKTDLGNPSLHQTKRVHCDQDLDTKTFSVSKSSYHNHSDSISNPTDDELQRRSAMLSRDSKMTTTPTTTTPDMAGSSHQHRSMSPLTLEETEVKPSGSPTRCPARKFGMANIQNVNPILLGEKSFFESLINMGNDPRVNMKRQESTESSSSSHLTNTDRIPHVTTETPFGNQSFQSNQIDDIKYYDELRQSEITPVDKSHFHQLPSDESSLKHNLHKDVTSHESRHSSHEKILGNNDESPRQQTHQYSLPHQQLPRRKQLVQQHHHHFNGSDSQEENIALDLTNTKDKIGHHNYQQPLSPQDIQISPHSDIIETSFPEHDPHLVDMNTNRHYSDSCVVPLHHGNHFHYNHHYPHHGYIQNQHGIHGPLGGRLYHQNHRKHTYSAPCATADHPRLETLPAVLDDDVMDLEEADDLIPERSPTFVETFSSTPDHDSWRGLTHRKIYIPPMASNLIPFSVVPNSTPVHHYTGGFHRTSQDVEKQEDERPSAEGAEDTERKRKTSSGRKISLVSLVRGRRSDKGKGKQPTIKHNRSLSLNRVGAERGQRAKSLQPQRSKEV